MNGLGVVVLIFATLASAQGGSPPQQGDCLRHTVVVNVRDKGGKFVPSLQAKDFRAKFGEKEINVASLDRGSGSLRVVILLDKSGSINSDSKLNVLRGVSDELVRSSPDATEFAVVAFASGVFEALEFGHSRAEILAAIDRFTSSPGKGQTALRDALARSSELLQPARIGDSVVVIGDSNDDRSKTSLTALQEIYWSKAIRMFFFELVDRYFQPQAAFGQEESAVLSGATGGSARRIERPDGAEILGRIREIEDELWNFYVVQVGAPQSSQSDSLRLELRDASDRRRKDVSLTFQQKHLPCAKPDPS